MSKRTTKSDIINVVEEPIVKDTKVTILGTEYQIIYENYNDNPDFKELAAAGFCNMMQKTIRICKLESYPEYKPVPDEFLKLQYKETLRHEIMHAFLYESGLDSETHNTQTGWGIDEEIVDWFAIQSPKIYKVFTELDLL